MREIPQNLVQLLQRSVERHAERPLFGSRRNGGWEWISYAAFYQRVCDFSAGLSTLGIEPGESIAIVSDNRLEWAIAAYATYARGACYVPMYASQKPEEWAFILRDAGAVAVLAENASIQQPLVAVQPSLPALRHVIAIEAEPADKTSFQSLCERGSKLDVTPIQPGTDEIAGLIYTSGTTGQPKGVELTHANICSNVIALEAVFPLEQETALSFLPWAHSFGQNAEMHNLINAGCAMAINDDLPNLLTHLAEVKPTLLFAVPRIFNRIYDAIGKQIAARPRPIQRLFKRGLSTANARAAGERIGIGDRVALLLADRLIFSKVRARFGGALRYSVSGSAALSQDVAEFISAMGIQVYEGYGLTETSPVVTTNCPSAHRSGSVGRAIPHVTVTIDRSAGGNKDTGDGEIVVHGPNVMRGYRDREEETAAVLMEDGGFRTGDLGRIDADGYLFITGRIKEQYKLENGKYVVPSPLEERLKLSPYIANVFLYGDNRPFNVAIVVPDFEAAREWARESALDLDSESGREELRKLIEAELAAAASEFKGYERARRFALSNEDFTTENGLLTPTLKLRRDRVLAQYRAEIDALYA